MALEKVKGPTTCLPFLGIILDSEHLEASLPEDKLTRIQVFLVTWLDKKYLLSVKTLSLVGLLQHAVKVMLYNVAGFISRMYATAVKVKELSYFTRLNSDFQSDLS